MLLFLLFRKGSAVSGNIIKTNNEVLKMICIREALVSETKQDHLVDFDGFPLIDAIECVPRS